MVGLILYSEILQNFRIFKKNFQKLFVPSLSVVEFGRELVNDFYHAMAFLISSSNFFCKLENLQSSIVQFMI